MSQYARAKEWSKSMKAKGYMLLFPCGKYLGNPNDDFESFRMIKAFGYTDDKRNGIRCTNGKFVKLMATFRFYKFRNSLQKI